MTPKNIDVIHILKPVCYSLVGFTDDLILAGLYFFHIDFNLRIDHHTEFVSTPCQLCNPRTTDQCLGGDTADIDTCTAKLFALDDSCLVPFNGQSSSQGRTRLTSTDNDCVMSLCRSLELLCMC